MRKTQVLRIIILILGGYLIGFVATPYNARAKQQIAAEPVQNVAPPAGLPGTEFSFYAMDFDGNEKVAYWFNAPDGQIYGNEEEYVVYAYRDRADWTWQSPADAPMGYWTAVARGMTSGMERVITFYVGDPADLAALPAAGSVSDPSAGTPSSAPVIGQPPGPPPAPYGVEPEVGYRSEQFSFFATGFNSFEKVGYWFNDPSGKVYGDSGRLVVSSETGRVSWKWVSPDDARIGIWTAVVHGWDSQHEVTIQFRVIDPTIPQVGDNAPVPPSQTVTQPSAPQPAAGPVLQPSADLPANAPSVAVEPLVGAPGTRFALSASGYPPRETVYYAVVAPDGTRYEKGKYDVLSDEKGTAYWTWKSPDDAIDGIWMMEVWGDTLPLQQTIYFEIQTPGAVSQVQQPDAIAVDPPEGFPGSRFFFYATGFPPGETVHYWAVDPNGNMYDNSKYEVLSNEDGRADWNWKVPEDGEKGTWTMFAEGDKSLIQRHITINIY